MLDSLKSIAVVSGALPSNVRVTTLLAQGGQGVVYRGTVAGEAAAVKLYLPHQVETRIDREIEALRRLDCSAIAKLMWSGEVDIDGQPVRVVATQLIDGVPLNDLLRLRALTHDEVGALLYDVTEAICHLWTIRLVHRDLKPSNIIMLGGRAVVIDLGVARHVDQSPLTATGNTWGTFGYMSPEQTRGVKQLTCKSDLFALGIIAVESVLQRHPTSGDQLRLLSARMHESLPGLAAALPTGHLVRRLLMPRPTGRPAPDIVLGELAVFARG